METLEHTFPMPRAELHKLDELRHQLPSQKLIRSHVWMMVLSGLAGYLLAFFWPRK